MSFPLPVHELPCLPSHCHTQPRPLLHFLWSILESVREEKHMHASCAHPNTPHTLCLSYTNTLGHARKRKRAEEIR